MRRVLAILLFAALSHDCVAQSAAERLRVLGDDIVQREFDLAPSLETSILGPGPRAGRAIVDASPDAARRMRRFYGGVLQRLEAIERGDLAESDRITYDMIGWRARSEVERHAFPIRAMSFLTPTGGLFTELMYVASSTQPLSTEADFDTWLARVEASAGTFDDSIATLRAAAREGRTVPRALVERSILQADAVASKPAAEGALWNVLSRYPGAAGEQRRAAFAERYRKALDERLLPALRRWVAFARGEYLQLARTTSGMGALPGGDSAYRAQIRYHTTLDLAPDEVHALGLREVARVRAELLRVARGLGFEGEIRDFSAWVMSNPAAYPFKTPEEVLEYLRAVNRRVEPALPRLFRRLPQAGFEIRLTDPSIAASASATYSRPAADGSRPGIFRIPVTDPKRIASFGLTALLMHEGMPGHHLDIGRKVEMRLPPFRDAFGLTVYSEGWGLYAEGLGHELGVYDEPWALLGRYSGELHRAARLVVDTGLHSRGWSREQAIRYLVDERGQSEAAATVAIERYMSHPGQALAYKIGELEILKLRDEAKAALGERFDLRDFHEAVLGGGPLTLELLRERVRKWAAIGARAAAPARAGG